MNKIFLILGYLLFILDTKEIDIFFNLFKSFTLTGYIISTIISLFFFVIIAVLIVKKIKDKKNNWINYFFIASLGGGLGFFTNILIGLSKVVF